MVILGIDPGLNVTGFGVIRIEGTQLAVLAVGDVRPPRRQPLSERLAFLHQELTTVMDHQQAEVVVLETVFTHHRYPNTASLMAHARGVACLVAQQHQVPVIEYSPARVKKALTGYGTASKDQMARMVEQWVGYRDPSWSYDATDALGLAIAHALMRMSPTLESTVKG